MEKKIDQYLPLYLGQKVRLKERNESDYGPWQTLTVDLLCRLDYACYDIQLQLRSLSSMTEEDRKEWNKLKRYNPVNNEVVMYQEHNEEQFLWLLSKGFDIFGLKEKGLCLYPEEL